MHGIVPPYILERLRDHSSEAVAERARRTLTIDADLRLQRRTAAVTPAATGEAGPQRAISDAQHGTTLPGVEARTEGQEPTGDEAVDEAYDGLGITWTMLFDAFGRNSLDGAGRPLLATVHYDEGYDNAFWDGESMVFGDGDGEVFRSFTNAVDIIGHELGHGVIQSTTDLVYQDQPGALNESIADVIGSLAKQHHLGQTAADADWLIGDGIFTESVQGVALRSMRAPGTAYDDDVLGKDPQPAVMADFVVTTADYGGVHINSGIPNHAFYLAATVIGGHAWEGAGAVWLDVLQDGSIGTDADFSTFAAATIAAAERRFGADAAERTAIAEAWSAVGVVAGHGGPAAPTSPAGTVRVERSGGQLGSVVVGEVLETELPQQERALLAGVRDAVAASDDPTRDAYAWRIVRADSDVTVGERALPDDTRALLRRILERGTR